MGLFNKLKNALFEVEEIEVSPSPEKVISKEESVEPKKREVYPKEELPREPERDLFKAENTFKFPDFDEEEFVTNYRPTEIEEKPKTEESKPKEVTSSGSRKNDFERLSPLGYDTNTKNKNSHKETRREKVAVAEKKKTEPQKGFRPSPVISPVYGVLDKNYKKEDILPVQTKEKVNVDMIRNKAFGTLEEDIAKTLTSPKRVQTKKENILDDYLSASADSVISLEEEKTGSPLNRISRASKNAKHRQEIEEEDDNNLQDFGSEIEKELEQKEDHLEVLDKEPKNRDIDEDTLESDLFDLIDSMYDNREEE